MRNGMKKMLVLLLAACVLFFCAGAGADSMHREIDNPSFDMDITVGYNGAMTYGKVMPVRVRIRNFGDDFEGVLGMNAYANTKEYDRYEKPVAIPAGSEREFELWITVYTRQSTFTAELVKDGETVCSSSGTPKTVINPSAMLVGVFSSRAQNLKNLDITRDNDILARYEYWQTIPLTQDNFPDDLSALKSFGVLVFDDLDPAVLSDKQRQTLDAWLNSGRILLCGGGANAGRNVAFFNGYTGLSLEEVTTSDDVIQGLERILGRKESGKTLTTALARYSCDGTATESIGDGNLIYRTAVRSGRIYTAAFETGDPRLNSENFMHFFWQYLLVNQDQDLYSSVVYANAGNDDYNYVNASSYIPVQARSMLLPGVAIVAGMLLLACVIWWILKKKDLRQWMWLALPVISLAAVGGLLLLSTSAETNRPAAVITESLVQDDEGTIQDYSVASIAVPSFGQHSYSMPGDNLKVLKYDYVDYDEEEPKKDAEPVNLRVCYSAGGENAITVESTDPWQMTQLTADTDARIQGRIDGSIWMEEDGLHAEIQNLTDQKFEAGQVVTSYGYASVPALAPGESASILMKHGTYAAGQTDVIYKDGFMYMESPGLYQVVYAATGYDDTRDSRTPEEQAKAARVAMITNAADTLRRGQGGTPYYGAYESALFFYCAKPENRDATEVFVDGKPVEGKASTALFTAEMNFLTVGRTGVVFRSAGMDVPTKVETDNELMPTDKTETNIRNMYYFMLSDNPTFLFTLGNMEGISITKLQVLQTSYYANQLKAYALNIREQKWEEIPVNADIRNPERFLDKDGKLYVQFRLDGSEMYADISMPMINLEGRQENAAD